MKQLKLSIIIVHYHEDVELLELIDSIYKSNIKHEFEIIIADNEIESKIKNKLNKKFPKVIYKSSGGNIGYGPALNVGEKFAKGEYVLLLNPDLKVAKNSITKLVDFMDKNLKVALCGPQLINQANGIKQYGTKILKPLTGIFILSFLNKLFPNNKFAKSYVVRGNNIPYQVEVVPGSAMFLRKAIYDEIGKLDDNIFIYFEETDLAIRIKKAGYKAYIVPQSVFYHDWEPVKNDNSVSKKIFERSRFYFFKKNYGPFSALLVEIFARFSKYSALLLLTFVLALFLRFFRLKENLEFGPELAMDYLGIKDVILNHQIPLMGPVTSHSWINFGPLYFLLMIPVMLLSGFNPVGPAIFMALISCSLIILNYFVIKSLFERKEAIISSFLLTVSPLFLIFARWSRFYSLLPFLLYFFIIFLARSIKEKKINIFLTGLFLGLMIDLHYSALILLPVIFTVFFTIKKRIFLRDFLYYISGLIVGNINLLIFSFKDHFSMVSNLFLWIPYRFAGFLGFYKSNNLNVIRAGENLYSINDFISKLFFFDVEKFALVVTLLTLIIFILLARDFLKEKKNIGLAIVLNLFFVGILALFILGNAPIHYYSPILPVPILLVSIFISKYAFGNKKIFLIIPMLVFIANLPYLFSKNWFYQEDYKIRKDLTVPYRLENDISSYLVRDSKRKDYKLKRVGAFDYYEKDYAQNYIYLAWLKGNSPKDNAKIEYTIYEGTVSLVPNVLNNCKIFANICITKTE